MRSVRSAGRLALEHERAVDARPETRGASRPEA